MKRIINWTFGSFFRTFGRFLFYIIIGYLLFTLFNLSEIKLPGLFDILDVYAETTDSWFFDLSNHSASNYNFINHTSNGETWLTNDTQVITQNVGYASGDYYNDLYIDYNVSSHTGTVSIASNGVSISYFTNSVLKQNYLYNIASYMCSNTSITGATGRLTTGQTASDAINNDVVYTATNRTAVGNVLRGRITADNLTNCVVYTTNVVPIANSSWVNLKLTSSSTISSAKLYFAGFELNEIGIYDQQLQSIIQNSISSSNIATTNDINSMQSSIEENQNQNAQDIIDNQNTNSQAQINSQKVCQYIDKSSIEIEGYYLNSTGGQVQASNYGITKYIPISSSSEIKVEKTGYVYSCFYNTNKEKISCLSNSNMTIGQILTIPSGSSYFRASIFKTENRPAFNICTNGNQALNDAINDDSIDNSIINDMINSLNHDETSLTPFSDFINLPLIWIQNLFASGETCTEIHLPLPYLDNKYLDLPCMTSFWQQMGVLGTLVQTIWIAIVGIRIFNGLFLLTCDVLDPNPDKDMTKLRTWEL